MHASLITPDVNQKTKDGYAERDRKIDNIITSKKYGIPIMIGFLCIILWITVIGANYPSEWLSMFFAVIEGKLSEFLLWVQVPAIAYDVIIYGIYRTVAWVISVMLPPMAIFFPLFTLLEETGYLPRVAYNLEPYFRRACCHGKQALTMCMGFGCNAAGVVSCNMIKSPRERLIAMLTNNFVPCNGRFPTLIALAGIFFCGDMGIGGLSSVIAAMTVVSAIILGVLITLLTSKLLAKTVLKGMPSSFDLELPPYRKPQVRKIIICSLYEKTRFVLGRAVAVAAPAGLIIWILANVKAGDVSILTHCAMFFDPFGRLLGMDGYIIMAFILGIAANETVIPILLMSYMAAGHMMEITSLYSLQQLFLDNGWSMLTAICVMLFSLNHWPCTTTLLTIKKESGSAKWMFAAFLIPTVTGIIVCFTVAQSARLFCMIMN